MIKGTKYKNLISKLFVIIKKIHKELKMATHYVTLSTQEVNVKQMEELKKITLPTPEDRNIQEEGKETYYRGTLSECEAFINRKNKCLKKILIIEDY